MMEPSRPVPSSSSSPPKPSTAAAASSQQAGGQGRRNGRKYQQDVNHLLAFTLPPRVPPPSSGPPRRSNKRNPGHGVYDKQRYVSSTFRMVVNPASDYTALFADPDLHIAWDDILQIIVDTPPALSGASTSASTSTAAAEYQSQHTCPICLSEPTAPRMTRCGHIFCLSCMLHYLALAEGPKWRKCPVCWDAVYSKDLKPVQYHLASPSPLSPSPSSPSSPHTILQMQLLRRPPLTTLALPRSPTWPSQAVPPLQAPWNFTPDAMTFAKFMLGSPEYMLESFERELRDLKRELIGNGELEAVFVNAATERVRTEMGRILDLKANASVMGLRKRAVRELDEVLASAGEAERAGLPKVEETSSSEVEEDTFGVLASSPTSPSPPSNISLTKPPSRRTFPPSAPSTPSSNFPLPPDSDSYFFYQSSTGAHIFLQPLDIRILKSHFGSYASMPSLLSIPISAYDEGTMNEELRKRCKWLNHIPLGADVVFVEAELEGVVGKGALESFQAAIRARKGKRKEKGRKEDREKVKSEIKEREKVESLREQNGYSTWRAGNGDPFFASASSSFGAGGVPTPDVYDFPPTPATANHSTTTTIREDDSSNRSAPVWGGGRTFASSVLRPQSNNNNNRAASHEDEEFDERWHDFEENLRGRGGGGRRSSNFSGGSSTGANSGGAAPTTPTGGGGKKKGKKLIISLTAGAGGRGA